MKTTITLFLLALCALFACTPAVSNGSVVDPGSASEKDGPYVLSLADVIARNEGDATYTGEIRRSHLASLNRAFGRKHEVDAWGTFHGEDFDGAVLIQSIGTDDAIQTVRKRIDDRLKADGWQYVFHPQNNHMRAAYRKGNGTARTNEEMSAVIYVDSSLKDPHRVFVFLAMCDSDDEDDMHEEFDRVLSVAEKW